MACVRKLFTFANLMNQLVAVIWNANPEMFTIPGINWPVRWYGLLFACAFIVSQLVMTLIFKKENRSQKNLDTLTLYIILGTVLGARLGHMLFYDFKTAISHPLDIFKIWEGGLASHGGAFGILIAMWLFCKKTKEDWIWLADRLIIVVAVSAMFIRAGNLMNSEIIGKPTETGSGFVFINPLDQTIRNSLPTIKNISYEWDGKDSVISNHKVSLLSVNIQTTSPSTEDSMLKVASEVSWYSSMTPLQDKHFFIDPSKLLPENQQTSQSFTLKVFASPRHPAQLCEAVFCLFLFVIFFFLWIKKRHLFPKGFFFGLFITLLFTERMFSETLKENQVAFEEGMKLNMGQILSIPFIIAGIILMIWSKKQNQFHQLPTKQHE